MGQTLKEKTASGLFWGGFSNISQQIVTFGFGIVMARILLPEDFGLVGMLAIFSSLATILQDSGFSMALLRRQNTTDSDCSTVFFANVFISITLYFLLFFLAPVIASYYRQPLLTDLSRVVFLSFLFSSMSGVQNTLMAKKMELKKMAIVNLLSVLISSIVGLTFALLGYSYWSIAIQMVALSFVRTVLLWLMNDWKPTLNFNLEFIKEIFPFSFKLLISSIIGQISSGIYSLLLGRYYDEREVGYYSQASKWCLMPLGFVNGIISSAALPVLAELNNDEERLHLAFRKILRCTAFLSFPLIWGFAFIAEELILITVTDRWIEVVPIIRWLCVWMAFLPIYILYNHLLTMKGYSGVILFLSLLLGVLTISGLILTVSNGILTMIGVNMILNFIILLLFVIITKTKLKYSMTDFVKDTFPFVIVTLFSMAAAYFIVMNFHHIYVTLLLKIIITAIIYVAVMKFANVVIFKEVTGFLKQKIMTGRRNER